MALDDDSQIDIVVKIHDEVSEGAKRVIRSEREIGIAAAEATPEVDALGRAINDQGDESDKAALKNKIYERSVKSAGNETAKSSIKISIFNKRMSGLEKNLNKASKGGVNFMGLFKVILIPLIFDAIGAIATLGSALGALGAAGVAGLAPLTGLIVAYPGYLAAIAQGVGAFKLAFSGVGNAITTLLSPGATSAEIEAAMKNLTPAAQKFAKTVAEMRKPMLEMRKEVQDAMMPSFTRVAKTLQGYLPMFRTMMGQTAKGIAQVTMQFNRYLKSSEAQQGITAIMGKNSQIMQRLGGVMTGVVRILVNILKAAGPMLLQFSDDMLAFVNRIADSTGKNQRGLGEFFQSVYRVTKKTIKWIADMSMALYNVFQLAVPLAHDLGDSYLNMAENFRKYTESGRGQAAITKWFKEMKPIIFEVGYAFRDLSKFIGSMSMDGTVLSTLKTLRTEVGPVLGQMTRQASGQFLPALAKILANFAQIIVSLQMFPVVLTMIADGFGAIAKIINSLPKPMVKIIGLAATLFSVFKFAQMIGAMKAVQFMFGGLINIGTAYAAKMVTGAEATALLSASMKSLVAKTGIGLLLIAVAALVTGFMDANAQLDDMESKMRSVNSELRTGTSVAVQAAKQNYTDLIDTLNERIDKSQNIWRSFWNTPQNLADAWAAITGGETSFDREAKAIEQTNKALSRHATLLTMTAGDLKVMPGQVQDIIDKMGGLDRTQTWQQQRKAIQEYYNVNIKATPAVTALHDAMVILGNSGSTGAEKLDAFKTALESVLSMLRGGDSTQATVALAKNMDNVANSFKGVKISVKDGKVVFDAANKSNWALNDALKTQGDNLIDLAVAKYKETNSVEDATKAYQQYYLKLVNKVSKGLNITKTAAESLISQYASAPSTVTTTFSAPGLLDLVKLGATQIQIMDYLSGKSVTIGMQTFDPKAATVPPAGGPTAPTTKPKTWIPWAPTTGLSTTLTPKAEGGPVSMSGTYLVGERGPEAFISRTGQLGMVGLGGPEILRFAEGGTIIPNHELDGEKFDAKRMNTLTRAITANERSIDNAAAPINVHIGSITQASEFDVIEAVKKGIAKAERNRRERM